MFNQSVLVYNTIREKGRLEEISVIADVISFGSQTCRHTQSDGEMVPLCGPVWQTGVTQTHTACRVGRTHTRARTHARAHAVA